MAAELLAFFATHPVFSRAELTANLCAHRLRTPKAVDALLRYHVRAGHLLKLRRGLYAAVPAGADPETSPVDPYLLASRLAGDAVLGYHTALGLHGKAHSVFQEFHFLTGSAPRPFRFRGQRFCAVAFPRKLVRAGKERFGVEMRDRSVSTSLSPGSNAHSSTCSIGPTSAAASRRSAIARGGRVLRPGSSHRVRRVPRHRDDRCQGRFFPRGAPGAADGE